MPLRVLDRYVAIEGLDGAGKSTLRMELEARLRQSRGDAYSYHDPNRHLPVGALIYHLRESGVPLSDELAHPLFAAGSIEAQEEALRRTAGRNCPIVADRSPLSNYVMLPALGLDRFFAAYENFAFPRLTFFLDVPLALAQERVTKRDGADDEARWLAQNYATLRARFAEVLDEAGRRGLRVVTIPIAEAATPGAIAEAILAHIPS